MYWKLTPKQRKTRYNHLSINWMHVVHTISSPFKSYFISANSSMGLSYLFDGVKKDVKPRVGCWHAMQQNNKSGNGSRNSTN